MDRHFGAGDVVVHRLCGRRGVGQQSQRATVVGGANGEKRLLRLSIPVERRRPGFDGTDTFPFHRRIADRLSVDGGPWEKVAAWAGPWPVTERWWSVRRRRARLQVVTEEGVARLLCSERGRWWVEALYD